jgi:hypothetical protein
MRKLVVLIIVGFLLAAGAIGTITAMTAHPEQVTLCAVNGC